MKTVSIHQPSYLVWPPLLEKMALADIFIYLDDAEFTKRSEIHRNRILAPQGPQWISVPNKASRRELIRDVKVANAEWAGQHRTTISHFYRRCQGFRDCQNSFSALYDDMPELLADVNIRTTEWLREKIGVSTPTLRSSELGVSSSGWERVLDLCLAVGAERYLTGTGSLEYLNFDAFREAGVQILVQRYRHLPYPQQFKLAQFWPHLSAVDMLFNIGGGCLDQILDRGLWEPAPGHGEEGTYLNLNEERHAAQS